MLGSCACNFFLNIYLYGSHSKTKIFQVKSNLKEHIKSHSDVKTFLCGFCGKALKNRQCLNRFVQMSTEYRTRLLCILTWGQSYKTFNTLGRCQIKSLNCCLNVKEKCKSCKYVRVLCPNLSLSVKIYIGLAPGFQLLKKHLKKTLFL